MGYTNYWYRTSKPITQEFVDAVKEVFEKCKNMGIILRDGWGENEPIADLERIDFNGNVETELDHENFVMINIPEENNNVFCFCKTARKPYDYAVKEVLKIAEKMGLVTDVSDDGFVEITTDAEWLNG